MPELTRETDPEQTTNFEFDPTAIHERPTSLQDTMPGYREPTYDAKGTADRLRVILGPRRDPRQLATSLGEDPEAITAVLAGQDHPDAIPLIRALGQALEISPDFLLGLSDDIHPRWTLEATPGEAEIVAARVRAARGAYTVRKISKQYQVSEHLWRELESNWNGRDPSHWRALVRISQISSQPIHWYLGIY